MLRFQNSIAITIISASLFSNAAEISNDSLAELSFMDLMNVEVTVASKKRESIFIAPGIISSYSATDIENFGYYTLKDLASITPGYSATSLFGEEGFETRGVQTSSFNNNRHLVLIDGIPINHVRANKAPVAEELSLFSAGQVEFLRGPASALYGTGAYYGVVNITPFLPSFKGTQFRSRIGFGGTVRERKADIAIVHSGDKQDFYSSVSYYQSDPSKAFVGSDNNENYKYWNDTKALSFQGNYKITAGALQGLSIGSFYFDRSSGLGEHWNGDFSHELNDLRWETFITYLRYKRPLTDLLNIDTYAKYNRSTESGTFTPLSEATYLQYQGTGELLYNYQVPVNDYQYYLGMSYSTSVFSITGGLDFDWRYQPNQNGNTSFYIIQSDSGTPYPVEENPLQRSDDFTTASLFCQASGEIPLLNGLIITGGIRNDIGRAGSNNYSQLSPRFSVVQKFSDYLNLKLLYGTALLAPGIKEIRINEEIKEKSPEIGVLLEDLEAETFSTFEAGVLFHNTVKSQSSIFNIKAEIAGFYNQSLNEIKSKQFTSVGQKTENAVVNTNDTVTAHGLECEVSTGADFGLKVFGNYSYAKAKNHLDKVPQDIPFHKINGGISYRSDLIGLYGSIIGRYVKEYSTNSGEYLPGYSVADLTIGWISKVGFGVDCHFANLLDEEYLLPIADTPLIPLDRRQVTFSLTAHF